MVLTRSLLAATAVLSLAVAHVPDLGKRAPIVALGFEGSFEEQKDEPYAFDESLAAFAPPTTQGKPKNATMPMLKDRSLELVADKRQLTCDTGYWYCPVFGKCCPRTTLCCSYGYCIDPDDTCCPTGACDPGWYVFFPLDYSRGALVADLSCQRLPNASLEVAQRLFP
ncbi:hypothetical protein P154DRAFT_38699 [Amniculicola lignicola CBS 123094]|uniref:Granulins domain-containing protein n=1 Tax=Amniculicola lignicola CBS 123094 TaxID=1392246 RepID=A0A6A5VZ68_9PLEO|nr:hypothetical protein P154DRAFT_38699 [Amniculicola lignicola CBS 123094]